MASAENIETRPREDSLFRAAEGLEQALAAPLTGAEWYANIRAALRRCTLAVETRLDYLLGPKGMEAELALSEPRLIPALDRLEASLAKLLVEFWEAKGEPAGLTPAQTPQLREMVVQMRGLAGDEFSLVNEAFQAPGGEN